jgi:magnesium-transporting ATPase (P-type)
VLRNGVYQEVMWQEVKVGDFVKVRDTEIIPADLLLLYSS